MRFVAGVGKTAVMIGRWLAVVIDCPAPRELASCYEELLGMRRVEDGHDWVSISAPGAPSIGFQQVSGFSPASWPDPERPPRVHIDVEVDDLQRAEEQALALGARLLESGTWFRVYADPAGHPFCLATPDQAAHYRRPDPGPGDEAGPDVRR